MTTKELKKRYMALQEEARSIDKELKPLLRRYRSICRKANSLATVADNDKELYAFDKTTRHNEPDGWNINILFRLSDFEEPEESFMDICHDNLVGIIKQPVNSEVTMTIGEQQKIAVLKSHVGWLKEAVENGILQDNGQIASLEGIIALFETQSKNIRDSQAQVSQARSEARRWR